MTRRVLMLAAILAFGGMALLPPRSSLAADHVADSQAGNAAAELIKRVAPHYPAKAVEHRQEGWVDLRFTVTPEGTTSDIWVVGAYPKGVFERNAKNALGKWIYAPRKENGIAVPQPNNRVILSFALSDSRTIRPELAPTFEAASDAIRDRNWDDALKALGDISKTRSLTLYEAAVLEELRGRLDFGEGRFNAAADSLGRALAANSHFDPDTRAEVTELMVMSSLNGRDFARGVQTFDHWSPPQGWDTRSLRRAVEAARGAMDTGRPVALPRLTPAEDQ